MADRHRTIVLWLIRSGQSPWQLEGRLQGQTDLPLAPQSKIIVMNAAGELKRSGPKMIHHPGDEAATETARMIGGALKARLKAEDELADPNLGLLEGLTYDEFEERYPTRYKQWKDDRISLVPPEGEEFITARSRVFAAVAKIMKRSRSGDAGIVVHDEAWAFLRAWLRGREHTNGQANGSMVERYALNTKQVDEMIN
ncbi:MAG TPA: histidine phosphatase family protein, partial [Phycisphaerales bacterium]|nr:histidine phosphatase family protein [Phycisphaerales bacterium]